MGGRAFGAGGRGGAASVWCVVPARWVAARGRSKLPMAAPRTGLPNGVVEGECTSPRGRGSQGDRRGQALGKPRAGEGGRFGVFVGRVVR